MWRLLYRDPLIIDDPANMYRATWYRTEKEAQAEYDRLEKMYHKQMRKGRQPHSIRFIQWPPSGAYERDEKGNIISDDITQGLHFANRWAQYQLL